MTGDVQGRSRALAALDVDCSQSDVTMSEAEQLIAEWLEEEAGSASLPYIERLPERGWWRLDGRFHLQGLANKLVRSKRLTIMCTRTRTLTTAD